jgi:hypothetical protein
VSYVRTGKQNRVCLRNSTQLTGRILAAQLEAQVEQLVAGPKIRMSLDEERKADRQAVLL